MNKTVIILNLKLKNCEVSIKLIYIEIYYTNVFKKNKISFKLISTSFNMIIFFFVCFYGCHKN